MMLVLLLVSVADFCDLTWTVDSCLCLCHTGVFVLTFALHAAGTQNVDAEFADICDAVSATKSVKHKTRLLFTKKHAPQLTAAILIPAFQQLNGINSITFYAPQLFGSIGAGFSGTYGALESSVVIDAIEMAGTLIGVATVDRYAQAFATCCNVLCTVCVLLCCCCCCMSVATMSFAHPISLCAAFLHDAQSHVIL